MMKRVVVAAVGAAMAFAGLAMTGCGGAPAPAAQAAGRGDYTVRHYRPERYAYGEYQANDLRVEDGAVRFRDPRTGRRVVLTGTVDAIEN